MSGNRRIGRRGRSLLLIAGIALAWSDPTAGWLQYDATSVHAQQLANGYAAPSACQRCHGAIAASYGKTGMGQSFHRADSASRVEDFQSHNTVYNQASDRHYTMVEREGAMFEQRFQIGFGGKETNCEEMRIDYVVGSGNHAHTYLHRTSEGKLIELPVSWYSEQGGYWEMSPGYDDAHQQDFRRAIPYECMACHNGYPRSDAGINSNPDKNIFGAILPEGIDCQRCHGPGQAHIDAVEAGKSYDEIRNAIVNPARLSRDRQMDVCMQCHLETTSWPLPHAIRRFGRMAFAYRPGEPLEDYQLAFDQKPGAGYDDKFQVVNQAYRLRKSACFQKSQMTCITCHDPHEQLRGEEATQHYVAVCSSCHTHAHAKGVPGDDKHLARTATETPYCLTCHMWKRRTEDAVHVAMTDHDIQRYKPREDPLAPSKHVVGNYRGEVVPYYPESLDHIPDGELYLAIAQTEDDANLQAGADQLQHAIAALTPADAGFYFVMGAADSKLVRNTEAIQWYEEALRRRPGDQKTLRALASTLETMGDLQGAAEAGTTAVATAHSDTLALTDLGSVYLKLGRFNDAKHVLQQALTVDPNLPNAAVLLGMALMSEGDTADAELQYRSAINLEPDLAEPHNNLARILARRGNYPEAIYEFNAAIKADPANVQIRQNYSIVLAYTGALDKAEAEAREAVRLAPQSAPVHANLGKILMKSGDHSGAEKEYRAALTLDAHDGEANLGLANLLVKQGKLKEAQGYYETAAKSPDTQVRSAALAALKQ